MNDTFYGKRIRHHRTFDQTESLKKESCLKSKNYHPVNKIDENDLRSLEYIKSIASGSSSSFEGGKVYQLAWLE